MGNLRRSQSSKLSLKRWSYLNHALRWYYDKKFIDVYSKIRVLVQFIVLHVIYCKLYFINNVGYVYDNNVQNIYNAVEHNDMRFQKYSAILNLKSPNILLYFTYIMRGRKKSFKIFLLQILFSTFSTYKIINMGYPWSYIRWISSNSSA